MFVPPMLMKIDLRLAVTSRQRAAEAFRVSVGPMLVELAMRTRSFVRSLLG